VLEVLGCVYVKDHVVKQYFIPVLFTMGVFAIAIIIQEIDSEDEQP
jgi:hypothetical protein